MSQARTVVFTDLDGTLLETRSYAFQAAWPALRLLRQKNIPLVLCSSKTKAEILHYRRKLRNSEPFISENGGGIFFPRRHGQIVPSILPPGVEEEAQGWVLRLGARYADLREAIKGLRGQGFAVRGFGDMDAEEVSQLTGLPLAQAEMAKMRDFDEPFLFGGSPGEVRSLMEAIRTLGLSATQGQYYHLLGDSDKGKAVSILSQVYGQALGQIRTVAIGDALNDLPMLEVVDVPMLVKQAHGRHDPRVRLPNLLWLDGIGPEGWNRGVLELLKDRDDLVTGSRPSTGGRDVPL